LPVEAVKALLEDMHLLAFAEEVVQLFPDGSLFVHIAMVLAMIWILNRTLYKPINRVLEARDRVLKGLPSEADELREKAASKQAEYQRELLDARSAGYRLIEEEHRKAAADHQKKLQAAKAKTAENLASERSELQNEAETARAVIRDEADKMADKIASNILNR
jgi:F-type H+-transporting ATPase subunit b